MRGKEHKARHIRDQSVNVRIVEGPGGALAGIGLRHNAHIGCVGLMRADDPVRRRIKIEGDSAEILEDIFLCIVGIPAEVEAGQVSLRHPAGPCCKAMPYTG